VGGEVGGYLLECGWYDLSCLYYQASEENSEAFVLVRTGEMGDSCR
jgi:hypothetical protein